jgi:hypothetical protein
MGGVAQRPQLFGVGIGQGGGVVVHGAAPAVVARCARGAGKAQVRVWAGTALVPQLVWEASLTG